MKLSRDRVEGLDSLLTLFPAAPVVPAPTRLKRVPRAVRLGVLLHMGNLNVPVTSATGCFWAEKGPGQGWKAALLEGRFDQYFTSLLIGAMLDKHPGDTPDHRRSL